jgi:hypothetical protein
VGVKVEFNLTALSGIVAASLAADSVLFALRNPSTNTAALRLKRLVAKWRTITGYTASQELSLAAYQVSAFGSPEADYTGGTDVSAAVRILGPDTASKPAQSTVIAAGNARIATTAGLSHAGTPTIASQPFAFDGVNELAAGATVAKGAFDLVWAPSDEASDHAKGLVLVPGRGFVIRNPIALGAGGTGRLFVDLSWDES